MPRRLPTILVGAALAAAPAAANAAEPVAQTATSQRDAAGERLEQRSIELINAATRAMRRDPACRQRIDMTGPTFTHAVPSAEMLATFALLRRPAIPQDRIAQEAFAGPAFIHGIYIDWVRMARAADGSEHYLVIAQGRGLPAPLSRACLRRRHAKLVQLLDGESPRLRRMTLRDEARLNRQEHPAGGFPAREAIFHFERGPDGRIGGGGGGVDLAWFHRNGLFSTAQNAVTSPQGISTVTGFVPDGVRTIEATFAQRANRGRHRAPEIYPSELRLTLPVQDNVVSFRVEREAPDAFPSRMVWRAADGSVVRTVDTPR